MIKVTLLRLTYFGRLVCVSTQQFEQSCNENSVEAKRLQGKPEK